MTQPAQTLIYRYLDTAGDGTGEKNAIGDYASTSTNFFIRCPSTTSSGVSFYLSRLIIEIEDTKGMEPEEYGHLGAALSAGYMVKVLDADLNEVLDLTDGMPIRTNVDVGTVCYDVDLKAWTNTTNETALARLTFFQTGSRLWLKPGHRLNIGLRDDLTGLIDHKFIVQGVESY